MTANDPWVKHEVRTPKPDDLELPLFHLPPKAEAPEGDGPRLAVVCLHGASAWSDTFRHPKGKSLADALHAAGHSVWLANWRGSMLVVPELGERHSNMDVAAAIDLPAIFDYVRDAEKDAKREWPIAVVAHCLGSAALHAAIGGGHVGPEDITGPIVCSTIGLFFVSPWDGWLKAADHVLVRMVAKHPEVRFLNPAATKEGEPGYWPKPIRDPYDIWPDELLPLRGKLPSHDLYRRVAFMFGRPYHSEIVEQSIHDKELLRQFGAMDMGIYLQGTQALRRGHLAPMDALPGERDAYLDRKAFAPFRLSYITGHRNELWHREAVDRMVAWLRRPGGPRRVHKRIFHGYAHQDLYWGRKAHQDVLPHILGRLAAPP